MADKLIRAQVILPNESALTVDQATNTWYFDGDDGNTDASYQSAVVSLLDAFYGAMAGTLSDHVTSPLTVKLYDMRDPEPRTVWYQTTIAIGRTGIDGNLPNEVALCLSYQAPPVSGVPQARRRGRIYIGPLSAAGNITDSTGELRPSTTLINTIATAASIMENGLAMAIGSMKWAVYSPTTDATSSIDDAFNDVTDGWVDNAFDTQRRRGRNATSRTTWT